MRSNGALLTFVASFTDAWIETPVTSGISINDFVASFTDAWIETVMGGLFKMMEYVASFTDAWIETPENTKGLGTLSRIFYRCVD